MILAERHTFFSNPGAGASSIILNPTTGMTAGNTAVLFGISQAFNMSSVTDNKGNTWSVVYAHHASVSDRTYGIAVSKLTSSIANTDAITVNWSSAGNYTRVGWIYECDSMITSPLDKTALVDEGAMFTPPTVSSGTTLSQNIEVAFALFVNGQGATNSFSPASGWSFQPPTQLPDTSHANNVLIYKTLSSTDPITASGTYGRTDETWDATLATFKLIDTSTYIQKGIGALTG